jgi:acyl-CoA thioesterase FadM
MRTSLHTTAVAVPRNAFSPREAVRAGDVWRLFQDVAVSASIAAGWTPERYVAAQTGFVVRKMSVVHERELIPSDRVSAVTWIAQTRRAIVSRREIRLSSGDTRVAAASQEWVHVDRAYRLTPMSRELIDAFPTVEKEAPVPFPAFEPIASAKKHRFELEVWHTWMDALGHVNHPAYIDWCEEAVARTLPMLALSPIDVVPHADPLPYRAGARAGDRVIVHVELSGVAAGRLAWRVRVEQADGRAVAEGLLVRSLRQGTERWLAAQTST